MAKSPWSFKTAVEVASALKAKKVSSVELTQDAIGRIERHDGKINAVCVRDFDHAMAAARAADAALARGESKPLLGIPLTVKESYNIAGLPTTWGFPAQKDFKAAEDALSITRVKDAGGVIVGKTNVPLGLGDWQSYNEIYGTTNNPYDLKRTPGGSSGGSAAALAAGYGPLSLGSDIGGSLRVPAFHCGVYAHKPTFALVPNRGHTAPPFPPLPYSRDLAVVGPMARGAADLSLLLDVMAGPDPLEAGKAYSLALPPPRHTSLKDFRILLIDSDPLLPTDKAVRAGIETLAANLGQDRREGRRGKVRCGPTSPRRRGSICGFCCRCWARASCPRSMPARRPASPQLAPDDMSLRAERLRGIVLSHKDWVMADNGRTRLNAQWRELFKSSTR